MYNRVYVSRDSKNLNVQLKIFNPFLYTLYTKGSTNETEEEKDFTVIPNQRCIRVNKESSKQVINFKKIEIKTKRHNEVSSSKV